MIYCVVDGEILEDIPCGIRLQVPFCIGSEVSVSDIGRRDDAAAKRFEILLDTLLMAASDESYMRRIGHEVRKTARRINAINELIIPRRKEQLQYISRALEEREREDILRLKKLKKG
ncbi:MAG TPA: hypothetical protein DDX84_07225 [Nitrospiraceae bacterium]|nr:MAG: hypothetical protein A2Z60_00115 [Nitrospirae bacterium RIFCSPLOWO2_02_42_7]OGW58936.1 MAG: hypothetical protein A3D21_08175 [Nitrospirae bacterium RIFCSPHIGHO2_02_FULL_42_12]HBI23975.1 hypothetical protein [Nitrospiraceae bacterium]